MSVLDEILVKNQITLNQLIELIKEKNPMLLQTRPRSLGRFKGYTLKQYREEILDLTQTQLAQIINDELVHWGISSQGTVTQKLISDWERGKKIMEYSPRKSWVIRNAYGLTDDEWVDMVDSTIDSGQQE